MSRTRFGNQQSIEYVLTRNSLILMVVAIVPCAIIATSAFASESQWVAFAALYTPTVFSIAVSAICVGSDDIDEPVFPLVVTFVIIAIVGLFVAGFCSSSIDASTSINGDTVYSTSAETLSWSSYAAVLVSFIIAGFIHLLAFYRE